MKRILKQRLDKMFDAVYFFLWLILGFLLNLVALAFAIPRRDPLVICTFSGNLVLLAIDITWMVRGGRRLAKKNSDKFKKP